MLDTIEYKTLPNDYLWLRFMNVKQRLREKNEFLKMQYNSIVIQLKPAVPRLHKKEQKFGFIKRVDKGWITTVKDLESWRFER